VEGKSGRERGRKTWLECVRMDKKELGRRVDAAREGQVWRGKGEVKCFGQTSEPCKHE